MLKQIVRLTLILFALVAAACGPAGVQVQGEGQVTVGQTATPVTPVTAADITSTTSAPSPTAVPPTSEIQVQVQVQGGDAAVSNGLEGTWQITDFSSGMVSVLGDATAQAYVGKQAVITSNSINFDGQACANVTFARHTASLAAFVGTDVATVATKLGITQSQIDVIDTTCAALGFNSFAQLDPNTLLININGTFFVLNK